MFQSAVTSPLEKYSVFASTRLDEVVHNVASAYCPHKLLLNDRGSQVNARYHRLPLRDTSLNFLQYGADVAINIGPFAEFYMLELPLAGMVRLQYGDQDYINRPGMAALLSPEKPVRSRWSSDCAEVMIKIDRRKLEGCLAEAIGCVPTQPLEFSPLIDLSSPSGRAISEYVSYLVNQARENSPVLGFGPGVSSLEKTLFNLLLTCQPHNYTDALVAQRNPVLPHYVVKAREYIHANLQHEIRVEEVAQAAGVTERALFYAFRRFVGVTPYAYVRNLRLEQVRLELTRSPSSTTITELAFKWGFSHMGRFARDYAQRFGEKPSATARR